MRRCKKCGDEITMRRSNARYCSIDCQEQRRNPRFKKPAKKKIDNVYARIEEIRNAI